jgi:signal peptidase I
MAGRGRLAGTAALWIAAGFVLGILLAAAAPLAIGDHSYVVRSGSMSPAIDTGDVEVVQPIRPVDAKVGDIVSFRDPHLGHRLISHRVRAIDRVGEHVNFVTQGDANTGQEHWSVTTDGTIGRVVYRVPKLGYAVVWISSLPGRIGLIIVPALLLMASALRRIWWVRGTAPAKPMTESRRTWRRGRTRRGAVLGWILVLLVLLGTAGAVWAPFTSQAGSSGDQIRAAADWVPPTASSSVIQKTEGGTPGYIRQGGTYRVYANVADSGNPASGVASVTGNVNTITSGQTAASLASGSFTVNGSPFNRESASLTAGASLAAGSKTYALTSTDAGGYAATQSGFAVIVDNTAPAGSDVQTANHAGGTVGKPELGDTATLTYTEPIDPSSIVAGWTGAAATNVVVRINNNVFSAGFNDTLTVENPANTAALPLGTVNLGHSDYVSSNTTFGATGTASTLTLSGSAFIATLGTASSGPTTATSTGTMTWAPVNGATDRAGNPDGTSSKTESGTADKEF